jgi:hypothetical protein
MKYFTPELIERLGSSDDKIADAAMAEWEAAVDQHADHLEAIRGKLPASLGSLWDRFYLHDANVLAMGQQGTAFVIVLRLDVPPKELVILNYTLLDEPHFHPEALPPEYRCDYTDWLYDEIGWVGDDNGYATHSILFSDGLEIELHVADVQIIAVQTLLPRMAQPLESPVPGVDFETIR